MQCLPFWTVFPIPSTTEVICVSDETVSAAVVGEALPVVRYTNADVLYLNKENELTLKVIISNEIVNVFPNLWENRLILPDVE